MNSQELDENDDITTYAEMIKNGDHLINIVIEGKDDKLIYDEFEEIYGLRQPLVTVFPVGGRNTVLGIFNELKDTPHIKKAIFIVDQDQWVLTGIDPQYNHPHIIYTHGYSFENDIFIDGQLDQDLKKRRLNEHNSHLPTLLTWYALEVDRIMNGRATHKLKMAPEYLYNPTHTSSLTTPKPGETFNTSIFNSLQNDYPQLLRGKTLLQYYIYLLNMKSGLSGAHTTRSVIDNVASNKGSCLNRIFSEVDQLYQLLTA